MLKCFSVGKFLFKKIDSDSKLVVLSRWHD